MQEAVQQLPWQDDENQEVTKENQPAPASQNADFTGLPKSRTGKFNHDDKHTEAHDNGLVSHVLMRIDAPKNGTPPGTRTPNQLIKSQLLYRLS